MRALAMLDNIWKAENIMLKEITRMIVIANLYACESRTMCKRDEQRLKAIGMKTYRRILGLFGI